MSHYPHAIGALQIEIEDHQKKLDFHQSRINELQAAIAKLRAAPAPPARTDGLPPYGGGG